MGMRIGFYPDECAEDLPGVVVPGSGTKSVAGRDPAPSKERHSTTNRFQLLSLDGTAESDEYENGLEEAWMVSVGRMKSLSDTVVDGRLL